LKCLRKCLIGFGAVLLAAFLLLWFLPARWVVGRIEPGLHGVRLQQVQGTLWNGRANEVVAANGKTLGQLSWQLSRRALLGQLQLQLQLRGPALSFSGGMRKIDESRTEWRGVNLQVDLAALGDYVTFPQDKPLGELQLSADRILLQGGWPLQMQAGGQWRQAAMRTAGGDIALGDLQWQVQAQGGVIRMQVSDDGQGPLHVDGQGQLSPLGWRLDATLQPRQTDPALRRWLAGLGPQAADGSVQIQRHGGLTGSAPPAD